MKCLRLQIRAETARIFPKSKAEQTAVDWLTIYKHNDVIFSDAILQS